MNDPTVMFAMMGMSIVCALLTGIIGHILAYEAYKDKCFQEYPSRPSSYGKTDEQYGAAMRAYDEEIDRIMNANSNRREYDAMVSNVLRASTVAMLVSWVLAMVLGAFI
jgi:hypothetical protein